MAGSKLKKKIKKETFDQKSSTHANKRKSQQVIDTLDTNNLKSRHQIKYLTDRQTNKHKTDGHWQTKRQEVNNQTKRI